jgi:hypothetical protein
MAAPQQNRAIGGITPLGIITITAGAPQKVTKNLNLSDKVYTFGCRQLGFSLDATPSGEVYVNYGNVAGKDTNATAMIIQSGTSQSLPIGSVATEGFIDANQWYLDGSASCVVSIYALDASN